MIYTMRRERLNAPGRRLLAVSDIHAHGHYLKKLLEKALFSPEDELIIIGDILEKGPYSLETLRYVMELEKLPNVHVLAGNVDVWQLELIASTEPASTEMLLKHIKRAGKIWGGSLFLDLCKEMGLEEPKDLEEMKAAKERAAICFHRELEFISNRPTVLEAGRFTFVHGGLFEGWEKSEGQDATPLLKYDNFLERCGIFPGYVVTGHWPVCLYRHDRTEFNPLIDRKKHVISIDGGCGLKRDGQLNCLIIPDEMASAESLSWVYWDGFEEMTAMDEQAEQETTVYIQYMDSCVERISPGREQAGELVTVRHLSTGRIVEIPEEYLFEEKGRLCLDDYCDYRFAVKRGERVAFVEKNGLGSLIKKDGVSCWYNGSLK